MNKVVGEEKSFAMELLNDQRKQNKRLFIIWIITFITLVLVTCYTIYLISDIGVVEETQTIKDVDTIRNSTIKNGGSD